MLIRIGDHVPRAKRTSATPRRRRGLTNLVKSADQPTGAITKRMLNKHCRTLRFLVEESPNIYYSGDELARILTPTLDLLERMASR